MEWRWNQIDAIHYIFIDNNCIGYKNPNSKEDRFNRGIAIDSLLDGDKSSGGGER